MAVITFKDLQGVEHSVDLDGKFNVAFNCTCETIMRSMPDKCIDLLCADPPYGDGVAQSSHFGNVERERERERHVRWNRFGQRFDRYKEAATPIPRGREERSVEEVPTGSTTYTAVCARRREREGESSPDGRDMGGEVRKKIIAWDVAPGKEVFDELFRVSRDQIIWGGNYFDLPPTRCFLVWRKLSISESFSMAMAEYAWTSFNANAKVFECAPQGKPGDPRFHATQKPIDLYRWVFNLFCKPGDTVFDPYLGSGSSRIAAYDAGLNFIGCEIDPVYFAKEEERFAKHTEQISLWE